MITGDEFNREVFRTALSRFASGVTVVTSFHGGEVFGMTVSAFSSIALDPRLVMVSLTETKETAVAVRESGWFVVNVLAVHQQDVADVFAWRDDSERFDSVAWTRGPRGLPLISGSLATFVCRVAGVYTGGDHLVFLGEAVAGHVDDGEPLIYSQGQYRQLSVDD